MDSPAPPLFRPFPLYLSSLSFLSSFIFQASVIIFCACFDTAAGHASVIMPPSRNAVDGAPGTPWSGGKHPPTGAIMPYGAACTNGTSICNSGQAAFWFSQGCGIGCNICNGNGSRIPNADHCPSLPKPMSADVLLDPQYRTANQDTVPGSVQDFWRFNPWRVSNCTNL